MANATLQASLPRGPFIGRYTGTTAAQNIHIGFKPVRIEAYNHTDGDVMWFWSSHDEANLIHITTTAGPVTAAIAVAQVDNGTVTGFSLPSNATINENAKVYCFIAYSA